MVWSGKVMSCEVELGNVLFGNIHIGVAMVRWAPMRWASVVFDVVRQHSHVSQQVNGLLWYDDVRLGMIMSGKIR